MVFPKPNHVVDRECRILALLAERGELSAKQVCLGIGLIWPAELEKVRSSLNFLEIDKRVVKVVRPTNQTRNAYYTVTNGDRDRG